MSSHGIDFFEAQFRKQVANRDFALNPFERRALPYLQGEVLDLGCGLGNLAIEAARRGCRVSALDGGATAVERIRRVAAAEGLAIRAEQADLADYRIEREYDAIVCIGLLMFLPETKARALLAQIPAGVRPGGIAALNALVRGTTFLDMFQPGHYHLFEPGELAAALPGWSRLEDVHETFPAPEGTVKSFDTVVARRPGGPGTSRQKGKQ